MGNTKRTGIPDSLERLLSKRKLMETRGKCTTLLAGYQELLLAALKGPRGDQSIAPIMSEKDEKEAVEANSGS